MSLPTVGPVLLSALIAQDMYLAGTIVLMLGALDRDRHLHLRPGADVDRSAHPPPGGPMSAICRRTWPLVPPRGRARADRGGSHRCRHAASAHLVAVQEAQAGRREPASSWGCSTSSPYLPISSPTPTRRPATPGAATSRRRASIWFDSDGAFALRARPQRRARHEDVQARLQDRREPQGLPARSSPRAIRIICFGFIPANRHLLGFDHSAPENGLFLLGTDVQGRDLWSRLMVATRVSLSIGLAGVTISLFLGVLFGGISGLYGGTVDTAIQRLIEVVRSIPTIPLWMGLAAALPNTWSAGQVYFAVTIIISLIGWTDLARVVRGRFLSLREEDFVVAAELMGASRMRIIFRHMLPSFTSHIIAAVSLALPAMIISETSLSFLGLGLRPPAISWGILLQDAQNIQTLAIAPWLLLSARSRHCRYPGLQLPGRRPQRCGGPLWLSKPCLHGPHPVDPQPGDALRAGRRHWCAPSDGADFDLWPGKTLGIVGEFGLRQERHDPLSAADPRAPGSYRGGRNVARSRRRGTGRYRKTQSEECGDAVSPRQGDRSHLPGADDLPVGPLYGRQPDLRGNPRTRPERRQDCRTQTRH